ncbi:MAG: replication-associated recombination protein A [Coriobacteriales bacterium]|nr:replication-associated recombination protein A [Coriobacteriales bacterium]
MQNIFSDIQNQNITKNLPLAVKMRPQNIDEIIGQKAISSNSSWLKSAIDQDNLSSIILYGPAGTGKTTLAYVIANTTKSHFAQVSAIGGTIKDLRKEIQDAKDRLALTGEKTILFIDEIHRFNKTQQDALLHAVENRTVILIGATTENPYFEVNSALNSRSRVIQLDPIAPQDIKIILQRACKSERGLNNEYEIEDAALEAISTLCGGDARSALSILELCSNLAYHTKKITVADVDMAASSTQLPYDKQGDMHYDIISAFIKSMRGSDPDATLYWLARMIDGGEDPKFIARRILIQASEDVGLADPRALPIAEAAFKSAEVIGYPECQLNLAHAALYLALAPKSNSACVGLYKALDDVRHGPQRQVPSHLRDRHRPGSENYGNYKYPHDYPNGWVDQQYLPDGLNKGDFYKPKTWGWEALRFPPKDNS